MVGLCPRGHRVLRGCSHPDLQSSVILWKKERVLCLVSTTPKFRAGCQARIVFSPPSNLEVQGGHTHTHTHTSALTHRHTHTQAHTHTHKRAHTQTHTHTSTHTHKRAHKQAPTHGRTHAHTHTHLSAKRVLIHPRRRVLWLIRTAILKRIQGAGHQAPACRKKRPHIL